MDSSQPSIFPYFCTIVERTDKIARELDGVEVGGPILCLAPFTRLPVPSCLALAPSFFFFSCALNNREAVNGLVVRHGEQFAVLFYTDWINPNLLGSGCLGNIPNKNV